MAPTTTLPADRIATATARLAELEAEREKLRDSVAARHGEIDQLMGGHVPGRHKDVSDAIVARDALLERAGQRIRDAEGRLAQIPRLLAEQGAVIAQAEAGRVPAIDDAIAGARAKLAGIPAARQVQEAMVAAADAHLAELEAAKAIGEPVPAGEPAATARRLAEARDAIEILAGESDRLERLVGTLFDRRAAAAVDVVASDRARILEAWRDRVAELLEAATRLGEAARALEGLEVEYRSVATSRGVAGGRIPTRDLVLFTEHEIESIAIRARGHQLLET